MAFKLKRDSLSELYIMQGGQMRKFYSIDQDRTTYGQLNQERGIQKLENRFLAQNFEFAYLKDVKTGNILHYYLPNTGSRRLDKKEYNKIKRGGEELYNFYLVPSAAARKMGQIKGTSIFGAKKSDVSLHWGSDLSKILIYRKGEKRPTYEYANGLFKKLS